MDASLAGTSESFHGEGRGFDKFVGRDAFVLAPVEEVLAFVGHKGPFREGATSIGTG